VAQGKERESSRTQTAHEIAERKRTQKERVMMKVRSSAESGAKSRSVQSPDSLSRTVPHVSIDEVQGLGKTPYLVCSLQNLSQHSQNPKE